MLSAGDQVATIGARQGSAENLPLLHRGRFDISGRCLGKNLGEVFVLGQVGVGEGVPGGGMGDGAVAHFHRRRFDIPTAAGELNEEMPGRGRSLAYRGDGPGSRPAAGRDAVIGHEGGVAHDQLNSLRIDVQLLGSGLGQFRPGALAHLHFAGQHGDGAVPGQMNAGGYITGPTASKSSAPATAAAAAAGPLRQGGFAEDRDEQAGAKHLHELTPIRGKIKGHPLGLIFYVQRDKFGIGSFFRHG